MTAYYNEIDPYAAEWLENLIRAKVIADGEVDRRDIREVKAADLKGFDQHHFFAGIGGWSRALRFAGWDDSRPVWTGSCPCQPFSNAGKRKGTEDDRHLWPAWFNLIRECRPTVVFGEQVASAIRHGWLDTVFDELERESYACAAAVLPACGIGAPHLRQRLWFVANDNSKRRDGQSVRIQQRGPQQASAEVTRRGVDSPVGDTELPSTPRLGNLSGTGAQPKLHRPSRAGRYGAGAEFWSGLEWLPCSDGKTRPAQSGIFPLADGLPVAMDGYGPVSRKGTLKGAGNAIVPQVAGKFISAFASVYGV